MQNAGGRQNAEYSHVPSKILHSVFCINHERFVIRLYNTGYISFILGAIELFSLLCTTMNTAGGGPANESSIDDGDKMAELNGGVPKKKLLYNWVFQL